jgi:hypothetical protein
MRKKVRYAFGATGARAPLPLTQKAPECLPGRQPFVTAEQLRPPKGKRTLGLSISRCFSPAAGEAG